MVKQYDHTDAQGRVRTATLTIDERRVAEWLIARMRRSGRSDSSLARMAGGAIEMRFDEPRDAEC